MLAKEKIHRYFLDPKIQIIFNLKGIFQIKTANLRRLESTYAVKYSFKKYGDTQFKCGLAILEHNLSYFFSTKQQIN
jgi:hypothetical protein